MKELVDYNNNFEDQRNNSKNIFQFGFINSIDNFIELNYLKETNLFNLNSYYKISYKFIDKGNFIIPEDNNSSINGRISIGQLIELPINKSIRNDLEYL